MTATLTSESKSSSRRALLAGALGGIGAWAASAIGRPNIARATDPNDVVLGSSSNTEINPTKITNSTNNNIVFWGASTSGVGVVGSSTAGDGVQGVSASATHSGMWGYNGGGGYGVSGSTVGPNTAGVWGDNSAGTGVYGTSSQGAGVYGTSSAGSGVNGSSGTGVGVFAVSSSNVAVRGDSNASNQPAILGESSGNSTGLQGYSGSGSQPAAKPKTGVYGYAAQDAAAVGVFGQTLTGRAVQGVASSGIGVRASVTNGTGVYASATSGVALRATGRLLLDNCAGLATIASGSSSVVVTPGIDLLASSAAVATLQGNPAGSALVKAVAIDASLNTLTIRLTANASATLKVAWHVFG